MLGVPRRLAERRFEVSARGRGQRWSKLVAQRPSPHLAHLARCKVTELERPIREANQSIGLQPEGLQHALDLAVLAFAKAERQPDVAALRAIDGCLDRAVEHPADGDPV